MWTRRKTRLEKVTAETGMVRQIGVTEQLMELWQLNVRGKREGKDEDSGGHQEKGDQDFNGWATVCFPINRISDLDVFFTLSRK